MNVPPRFRWFAVGALLCALPLLAAAATAARAPLLVVDGRLVPCDPPPLVSGGRAFVPVRVLAEALGREVRWDARNQAVIVELAGEGIDLVSALPPVEGTDDALGVNKPASVGGQQYVRGFLVTHRVTWDLGGRFKELRFLYGAADAVATPFERSSEGAAYAQVVADDKVVAELRAEKGHGPREVRVSVSGVKHLSIQRKWRHYQGGVVINPTAE